MNTDITTTETKTNEIANLGENQNSLLNYANEVCNKVDPFLKFDRGKFLYGANHEVLPVNSLVACEVLRLIDGYVLWENGHRVEEVVRHQNI